MFDRRQFLSVGLLAALGLFCEVPSAVAAASRATTGKSVARSGKASAKSKKSVKAAGNISVDATRKSRPEKTRAGTDKRSVKPAGKQATASATLVEPDMAEQSGSEKASALSASSASDNLSEAVRDYLYKMRNYDTPAPGDVILPERGQRLLFSVMSRLDRLQKQVGHGWFYLLGMDEAIRVARRPAVGAFPQEELTFLEDLFHAPASGYGFMDRKPLEGFTSSIDKNKVIKVSGMGNFIYRGEAQAKWGSIQRIMGDDVVLTSGVRGVIKQFHLFLAKAQRYGGNLSLASRSLAPPGYSFHGVGDFDVGQRGFGVRNFMVDFTQTPVFQELSERGFISLRYPRDNFLGVRFEPWHVKVVDV